MASERDVRDQIVASCEFFPDSLLDLACGVQLASWQSKDEPWGGHMGTKKVLPVVACVLAAGALFAASAAAAPRLWTDSSQKTLLRSVLTPPKNQPDALEFDNEGSVVGVIKVMGTEVPITCTEVELGTTVVANNDPSKANKEILETKLAMPFGIAEGDNCQTPSGMPVPTYFDTNAAGSVNANITITGGPPFIATVHKLKLSQNVGGTFCTDSLEGIKGEMKNATEGFVEEAPPNLNVALAGPITVKCGTSSSHGTFSGKFFLETMSTTTDTAFISP
jgi:hypothetical protein